MSVLKSVRLRREACFRYQSQRVLRVGVMALEGGRGSHRPAEPCDCAIRRARLITQESRPKLLLKILQICRDEQQSFAQRLKPSFALSVTWTWNRRPVSRCCLYVRSLAYLTLSKEGRSTQGLVMQLAASATVNVGVRADLPLPSAETSVSGRLTTIVLGLNASTCCSSNQLCSVAVLCNVLELCADICMLRRGACSMLPTSWRLPDRPLLL